MVSLTSPLCKCTTLMLIEELLPGKPISCLLSYVLLGDTAMQGGLWGLLTPLRDRYCIGSVAEPRGLEDMSEWVLCSTSLVQTFSPCCLFSICGAVMQPARAWSQCSQSLALPTLHPLLPGLNNYFIHYFVHSVPLSLFPKQHNTPVKLILYSTGDESGWKVNGLTAMCSQHAVQLRVLLSVHCLTQPSIQP